MEMSRMKLASDRTIAALLFAAAGALYLLTASCSLDEWDSVQFAFGVHDFDLWKHRPHPPGYPLYEFSGWVFSWLGWHEQKALTVCSALGGALFVAGWFGILRHYFSRAAALLSAIAIMITPVVWLTATKVLTDAPAAGFLAAELFFACRYLREPQRRTLIFCALAGAVAAGFRPQDAAVAMIPLLVSLACRRSPRVEWLVGFGIFLGGCASWFLPVMWLQAHLLHEPGDWTTYPHQLLGQWRYRIDKPDIYVGAAHWNWRYFEERCHLHFGNAWISHGLGIDLQTRLGRIGIALLVIGWTNCLWQRSRLAPLRMVELAWAAAYIAMIFCCLPSEQRYYMPIMPLLVASAIYGLASLPWRWNFAPLVLIGILLRISAPLAWTAHREEAPPLRLIRYLQQRFPPGERAGVWLCFSSAIRHAQWYAADFHLPYRIEEKSDFLRAARDSGQPVFCDNLEVANNLEWAGAQLTQVAEAHRSPIIYRKHSAAVLYEVRWP